MRPIKVLSYNIHKGFTAGNREFALGRIRDAIRSVQADVVFLQEVVGQHEDHSPQPQFEFLADTIWPHFSYGKNAVYEEGHHGNAILSKFPFQFEENIDISTNRFEHRGLLHGIVELEEGQQLHLMCAHLGLFERERARQVERLSARVGSHVPKGEPVIIAGDFNDWRMRASDAVERGFGAREVFQSLHGRHARTFPSWMPLLPLDRVYVRGCSAKTAVLLAGAPWSGLSDHLPLLIDIDA